MTAWRSSSLKGRSVSIRRGMMYRKRVEEKACAPRRGRAVSVWSRRRGRADGCDAAAAGAGSQVDTRWQADIRAEEDAEAGVAARAARAAGSQCCACGRTERAKRSVCEACAKRRSLRPSSDAMGAVCTWDSGRTQVCQLEFQTCKGAISQARNPVGYVYSLDIYGRQAPSLAAVLPTDRLTGPRSHRYRGGACARSRRHASTPCGLLRRCS